MWNHSWNRGWRIRSINWLTGSILIIQPFNLFKCSLWIRLNQTHHPNSGGGGSGVSLLSGMAVTTLYFTTNASTPPVSPSLLMFLPDDVTSDLFWIALLFFPLTVKPALFSFTVKFWSRYHAVKNCTYSRSFLWLYVTNLYFMINCLINNS